MKTLIHERVEQCRAGTNKTAICRVASGWVVLGDVQFLVGYSLLLPDPVVLDLNSLDSAARAQYLSDMVHIGDALLEATDAYRINYETLGNTEAALHTHIFPRYMSEEASLRSGPAWFYDWENATRFDLERDQDLMNRIGDNLRQRGVVSRKDDERRV